MSLFNTCFRGKDSRYFQNLIDCQCVCHCVICDGMACDVHLFTFYSYSQRIRKITEFSSKMALKITMF